MSKQSSSPNNFFKLSQQAADHLVSAAEKFMLLSRNPSTLESYVKAIAQHEESANNSAQTMDDLLHKTLITPFDRHDIHQLTRKLDDVLGVINRTAQRVELYQIQALPEDIQRIAVLALEAARAIRVAIKELENLKNADDIIKICNSIKANSDQVETILLQGLGKLFAQELDCKSFLKTKEIYEYSAHIVRECQVLASIIMGIVLEYS